METRLPPQNIELEESLLATILITGDDDLFELDPSDFYRTAHQNIYAACLKLHNSDNPIDLILLGNELDLEKIGGLALSKFLDMPPLVNIGKAVEQIKGYADLRRMNELSNTVNKKAFEAKPEEVTDIIDHLQSQSLKIGTSKKESFIAMNDNLMECIDHLEAIQVNGGLTGITTGFRDLDDILGGFQSGDLIVLAARPGMGKTALALNCIEKASQAGFVNYFYSLEMSRLQLAIRQLAGKASIDSHKIRSGKLNGNDWERILAAAGDLSNCKIFIDDTASYTYSDIQRRARKNIKKHGTQIIWIDYLDFLSGDKGLNRNQEIGTITKGLKQLAKELNIPVVLLCQLNRGLEQRENKRPRLSDLRDSGTIEQDADVVIFIYRDEYYNKDENNPNRGIAEIDVAKQRMGPTGVVRLAYIPAYTRFENLAQDVWAGGN